MVPLSFCVECLYQCMHRLLDRCVLCCLRGVYLFDYLGSLSVIPEYIISALFLGIKTYPIEYL